MMDKNKQIKKSAQDISFDSAQDKQDDIFRKMSASEKIRAMSKWSSFCLKLHRLNKKNGTRRTSN